TMGQRTGLSAGDLADVEAMYGAPTTIKEAQKDPITDTTVKEIQKDPISDPTVKEARKDPISDTTIKETRKDPIQDPTVKETRKDPIRDPTVREAARDPIVTNPIPQPAPISPFVLAQPSRFNAPASDAASQAALQVQHLAQAIATIEQHHADLVAAH